jgi:hypothetical protein
MAVERIRRLSAGTYSLRAVTADSDGAAVTAAAPSLTIKAGAGTTVFTGTPTAAAGLLTCSIPYDDLAVLDTYTCTWTGTVSAASLEWITHVELAGGHLFEIAELRAFDDALTTADYSGAACRAARTAAEMRLEASAHVAFVPRAARYSARGDGTGRLRVPQNAIRSVISATDDGTALTAAELAAIVPREWGALDRPSGYVWTKDAACSVHYEHGEDFPPEPVRTAAMILAREYLVGSGLPARATVEQTDVGFFRLSIAGQDRPTGIPEVDAVTSPEGFGRRRPLIG